MALQQEPMSANAQDPSPRPQDGAEKPAEAMVSIPIQPDAPEALVDPRVHAAVDPADGTEATAPRPPGPPSLLPAAPSGWSDPMTGTDGPRYWDRLISSERARVGRYRRPATVALVEVAGLEFLARQWGPDVAERALVVVARTLSREIRTSDHIARIDTVKFAVLLTETSEIAAINFVERARARCDRDLGTSAELVRVGFGWASPPASGDLADALALAAERLSEDLGQHS
jgi:diguanylate cyclase (GGDEF)-like protein